MTLEDPADVVAIVDPWPIAIECKRPSTDQALGSRIEEGYDQFRRLEAQGLNAIRLIALDLSVLINPNFDVLVSLSDAQAGEFIDDQIHRLTDRARSELERAARNSVGKARVDAFLFRVLCVVGQPEGGNERVGEFWRVAPLLEPHRQALKALDDVVRRLPGFAGEVQS